MADTGTNDGARDFLIEIGMEELPPRSLRSLRDTFEKALTSRLAGIGVSHGVVQSYATPRRLAVRIEALAEQQPAQDIERRGPSLAAAFDASGTPTRAALGFAASCGVAVSDLETVQTDKGAWLCYRARQAGELTRNLIPELVAETVRHLPIPKRMRWGAGDVVFVRPVHWLVVLFGNDVVPVELMGVSSSRDSRGHRFHHPDPVTIAEPAVYARVLMDSHVVADHDQRLERIRSGIQTMARSAGATADPEEDLLEEVASLVEWPIPVLGSFDSRFLEIPSEVLVSSMQEHQRYFPLRDPETESLLPLFITVANIDSRQPQAVVRGNERVIRPRLTDAEFFWNKDKEQKLESLTAGLDAVVYQKELGTLGDKTRRVASLACAFADQFGVTPADAERVAALAKCDLLTEMVGEFPDLQGTMGKYYARAQGEPEAIALAIEEHYRPRFAGDGIPESALGSLAAVCDRCDTLLGAFSIGHAPTGDKDPYALRRAGLGILRILIEGRWPISLRDLVEAAAATATDRVAARSVVESVLAFLFERLKNYYQETGHPGERFEAVRHADPRVESPLDFHQRMVSVQAFELHAESVLLVQINKRIRNILRKAGGGTVPADPDPAYFQQDEESALHSACGRLGETLDEAVASGKYEQGLKALLDLQQPLNAFFDQVLVMAEDETIKRNRLSLLQALQMQMRRIADLSHLSAG